MARLFIKCPSCAHEIEVDGNLSTVKCPLCKGEVDVKSAQALANSKEKHAMSVIKYEGPTDVIIWKHPITNFTLGSQLIVFESQEAIFFRDGKALDTFSTGRHTLTTEQLPVLKSHFKLPFSSDDAFQSEVYFINKVTQLGIKWGTDTRVRMFDPKSGLSIEIGAYGEYNLRISNARKLLLKLVGTSNELISTNAKDPYDSNTLSAKFKALVISKVKSVLAKHIKESAINILEVDEHMEELSALIKDDLNKSLDDYGINLSEFYILKILTPDDDPNFRKLKEQYAEQYLLVRDEEIKKNVAKAAQERRIVEAETGAKEKIIEARANAEAKIIQAEAETKEMEMKNFTYQEETKRKVGMAAMENQASGSASGLASDIIGLGVAMGVAGNVSNMAKDISGENTGWTCPSCGKINIKTNFCPDCGTKRVADGWNCPTCGKTNIKSNFCPDCGTKRVASGWNCTCGETNIKSNFCPSCGKKKGE